MITELSRSASISKTFYRHCIQGFYHRPEIISKHLADHPLVYHPYRMKWNCHRMKMTADEHFRYVNLIMGTWRYAPCVYFVPTPSTTRSCCTSSEMLAISRTLPCPSQCYHFSGMTTLHSTYGGTHLHSVTVGTSSTWALYTHASRICGSMIWYLLMLKIENCKSWTRSELHINSEKYLHISRFISQIQPTVYRARRLFQTATCRRA
jgi:hypothetical protein